MLLLLFLQMPDLMRLQCFSTARTCIIRTTHSCTAPHQPTLQLRHPPLNVWQLPPPSVHCVYCAMWLLFIVAEPQLLSLLEPRKSG
jgi:hypothetical protein